MKRAEFIDHFCAVVREERKRNFPNIRPSELAASAWSDQKTALRMWRKYRLHTASPEQLERILAKDNQAIGLEVPRG